MKLRHTKAVGARVSDDDIRAMLEAFAGPADLIPRRAASRRRRASRRTLVLVGAGIVALGVAVPGSLALLGQFSETPHQFIGDASQPLNARKAIESFIGHRPGFEPTLTSVRRVVTADTPDGEYSVYELLFTRGIKGTALISSTTDVIAGMGWGPPVTCPAGWALQAGGSQVALPGKTPVYITGQTSDAVASLDVLYPDGHSMPAVVSNGYFLAWVIPLPGAPTTRTGFSPPVTLIAHDAAGNEIGHLAVRDDGAIGGTGCSLRTN